VIHQISYRPSVFTWVLRQPRVRQPFNPDLASVPETVLAESYALPACALRLSVRQRARAAEQETASKPGQGKNTAQPLFFHDSLVDRKIEILVREWFVPEREMPPFLLQRGEAVLLHQHSQQHAMGTLNR
jgi:hypothetical protein